MLARLLGRFTDWALRKHLAPKDMPSNAKPTRLAAYTITDPATDEPYMTRVLFPRVFGSRPMLHHIHRADHERAQHNHPWKWAFSIVLAGSYDEERIDASGRVTSRHVKRFNWITDRDFHKITELHGDVWTLFVSGPRVQDWGFVEWLDGQGLMFTHWKLYLDRKRTERIGTSSTARA